MTPPAFPPALPGLLEVLERRAALHPERLAYTFLVDGEREEARLTYAALARRVRAVARLLERQGAAGERALLLFPPGLDYIVAFLGCLSAGVTAVPAYPPDPFRLDRTLPRLRAIVADARPRLALTSSAVFELAGSLLAEEEGFASLDWLATDAATGAQADTRADTMTDAEAARDRGSPANRQPIDEGTLAFLQYTSGSTGQPRGVALTHGNLIANLEAIVRCFGISPDDRVVSWLPPYHDMGLIGALLSPIYAGAELVFLSPLHFLQRPRRWLDAVSRYRATITGGPNFAYELCVRKVSPEATGDRGPEGRPAFDLSALEVAFVGAEPVRASTLARFAEAFAPCGFRREALFPCYGLAEATLLVTGGRRMGGYRVRSIDRRAYEQEMVRVSYGGPRVSLELVGCGQVAPGVKLRVVDPETRRPCAVGELGELWVSGPSVATGYWARETESGEAFGARLALPERGPDTTAAALRSFLRTGDLGFVDDRGELFVAGRRRDLIIVRGRNHHPQDIEATVENSHELVRPGGCVAFAVASELGDMAEEGGDDGAVERLVVVAEIVRSTYGAIDFDAMLTAVQRAVLDVHGVRIDDLLLVPPGTVPKTSSGKVQRSACRAAFLAGRVPLLAMARGLGQRRAARHSMDVDRAATLLTGALSAEERPETAARGTEAALSGEPAASAGEGA
ncbi:MAG TPA: fatty acyl-AMP ligase [Polyangia bacterium]|jgi:acyl-CoA synthetase (AMP-forming)/AMP-acid ligase II|nr:fatty acyl-AMP ligase [Polyangia bacterium]